MGEIVYNLPNTGDMAKVQKLPFAACRVMIAREDRFTMLFFEHLHIATGDIDRFLDRLEEEEELPLTEKQLILYYAVVSYSPRIYREIKADGSRQHNITAGRDTNIYEQLFTFAAITCSRLKHEYAHLPHFSKMAEMIDKAVKI